MATNNGIFIIYPVTLFKNLSIIDELLKEKQIKHIYIIEEPTYFTDFKFHKQKLILHRSSMKYYYDYLLINFGSIITYIDFHKTDKFYNFIFKKKFHLHLYDPIEHTIISYLQKHIDNISIYDNLSFMETYDDLLTFNDNIKDNKYRHDNFYKWNRTRLNIFLDENDKPLYGKWSFDSDNKEPFKSNYIEPDIYPSHFFNTNINNYLNEAKQYVELKFGSNFGLYEEFIFPISHIQAIKLLKHFFKTKINTFGTYQDAVNSDIVVGSHSCLSSSLNIGLITVKECVNLTIKSFNSLTRDEKKKQFHNYEGFIRQIIGWRSYMRLLYEFHGLDMYKMNFFNHNKKIGKEWYNATTNIYPIDILIKKVEKYAYLHHIERLMYIGNWSLIAKIHPKEIYKWFMITCIDAYNWVMVPNIHGMSQHALDNNILSMMTRPYFSSSNYLKNMSNLVIKNNNWTEIWNILYYNFIYENIDYLKSNYSIARQVKHWNDKSNVEKKNIIKMANDYLYQ